MSAVPESLPVPVMHLWDGTYPAVPVCGNADYDSGVGFMLWPSEYARMVNCSECLEWVHA